MSRTPRQLGNDEVRERFLCHIWRLIEYWHEISAAKPTEYDMRGAMEGLAFSILVTIDGYNGGMPAFVLAPRPHEDGTEYHKNRSENWYPQATDSDYDIAGALHQMFRGLRLRSRG